MSKFLLHHICILLLYSLSIDVGALSPDGQALVNFRTAIISSDYVLLQWRPEDDDTCGWKGVTCDLKSKRVTTLQYKVDCSAAYSLSWTMPKLV